MTPGAGTLAAWLLAGAFAWAGTAKLSRRSATATAFRALGVPAAAVAVWAVAALELAAAALLAVRPASGGVAALVLLAAFSAFAAAALRRGRSVACGCFGGSSRAPLSAAALVRNALLALLAGAALAAPAPTAPDLPAVVAAGAAVSAGVVVHALAALRARTGRLWDNRLEPGPGALV